MEVNFSPDLIIEGAADVHDGACPSVWLRMNSERWPDTVEHLTYDTGFNGFCPPEHPPRSPGPGVLFLDTSHCLFSNNTHNLVVTTHTHTYIRVCFVGVGVGVGDSLCSAAGGGVSGLGSPIAGQSAAAEPRPSSPG